MRTDQYIGLNERADEWLEQNARHITILTDTQVIDDQAVLRSEHHNEVITLDETSCGQIQSAFGDGAVAALSEYKLKNGKVAQEYIQAQPWSSGPCSFIALKVDDVPVPESLWTEEEISGQL